MRSSRLLTRTVAPGEWIRVEVPGDPWPVRMTVGDDEGPAFVDHERRRREVVTVAQRRCPHVRPGRRRVVVSTGVQSFEHDVMIV